MRTGLDVFLAEGLPEIAGKRAGLITNQTGVDRHLRSTIELLHHSDRIALVALFAPEHGIWGGAQAGEKIGAHVDARTGLPVHSLYGQDHAPGADVLSTLDAMVFDIADLGVRFATRLSLMANAQQAAAEAGIAFVVFDRPNPITGEHVEGNLLDPAFRSLVGCHPLPVRHGMTFGELAQLLAAERRWPAPVVVPMDGWRRTMWFDQTGLPWVPPSPNLPTLDSLTVYPGTCLLEGTNVSEGRGTTRPFELIGAPWIDPFALASAMEQRELPGVAFRPTVFTPTFSKHAGETCGGIQIHVTDRETLQPVALGIHLLHVLRALSPNDVAWQEGREGRYPIDRLLGSDHPRNELDAGTSVDAITSGWAQAAEHFRERRRPWLLYD